MILSFAILLLTAGAIYLACEFFVNGVEWLGRRLHLNETATGSVLAAFGTALPECAVTFVGVVFGTNAAQKDIGVGAALALDGGVSKPGGICRCWHMLPAIR